MSVATYTKAGGKATTAITLDKSVFGVDIANHELLKEAYVGYLANGRANLAVTKTRGLVSGGGKKPWRQKGTGRARVGSSRSPIWRTGGVIFGPTGEENYSRQLPRNQRRQALRQALSAAAKDDKIIIIETFECKDGKAKQARALLGKIGAARRVLIVVPTFDELLKRATDNLDLIKVVQASYLNVFDVLNADNIVISRQALDSIYAQLKGNK